MSIGAVVAGGITVLQYGHKLMEILPHAVKGVQSAIELWNSGSAAISVMLEEDRDPTDEEWRQLNATIEQYRTDLHTDDPDEMGDEPPVE